MFGGVSVGDVGVKVGTRNSGVFFANTSQISGEQPPTGDSDPMTGLNLLFKKSIPLLKLVLQLSQWLIVGLGF